MQYSENLNVESRKETDDKKDFGMESIGVGKKLAKLEEQQTRQMESRRTEKKQKKKARG